jgi:hypothetical protein
MMGIPSEQVDFAAVLVFEDGPERRVIEPHVLSASHPEVAYQCALAKGGKKRYGMEFVGLAELAVTAEEIATIGETEGGNAIELVIPKERLSAFHDPRWPPLHVRR